MLQDNVKITQCAERWRSPQISIGYKQCSPKIKKMFGILFALDDRNDTKLISPKKAQKTCLTRTQSQSKSPQPPDPVLHPPEHRPDRTICFFSASVTSCPPRFEKRKDTYASHLRPPGQARRSEPLQMKKTNLFKNTKIPWRDVRSKATVQ